ncbi:hypothetical protein C8R42DRAFT_640307 [Lentinula raphanica]|nr:hypothetical protein C8R42DRAFT_640307 [Lentinula raphanica]
MTRRNLKLVIPIGLIFVLLAITTAPEVLAAPTAPTSVNTNELGQSGSEGVTSRASDGSHPSPPSPSPSPSSVPGAGTSGTCVNFLKEHPIGTGGGGGPEPQSHSTASTAGDKPVLTPRAPTGRGQSRPSVSPGRPSQNQRPRVYRAPVRSYLESHRVSHPNGRLSRSSRNTQFVPVPHGPAPSEAIQQLDARLHSLEDQADATIATNSVHRVNFYEENRQSIARLLQSAQRIQMSDAWSDVDRSEAGCLVQRVYTLLRRCGGEVAQDIYRVGYRDGYMAGYEDGCRAYWEGYRDGYIEGFQEGCRAAWAGDEVGYRTTMEGFWNGYNAAEGQTGGRSRGTPVVEQPAGGPVAKIQQAEQSPNTVENRMGGKEEIKGWKGREEGRGGRERGRESSEKKRRERRERR